MYLNNCFILIIKKYILIFFFKLLLFESANNNFEQKLSRFNRHHGRNIKNNDIPALIKSIKKYIELIHKQTPNSIHYENKFIQPKISFISTVLNKEHYLNSLIISVQKQILQEFEIIFIDDFSSDNSVKIINEYIENDKRILLIKNKKNKGTLYSRSQGALHSKGEYIIFIDSDDMILKNGIFNSYNYIKKNNLSIVQFNTIFKRNETMYLSNRYFRYKDIIKQPFLSYVFYYNEKTKRGDELNTALWDKLINRDLAIKSINFIGNNYLNEKIKIENDVILLFSLFRNADSYQYINQIGYYYIRSHNDSITNTWKEPKIARLIIRGLFTNIKFLYEKTGNTYLDKLFCIFKLQQSFKRYIVSFSEAKKEYTYVKSVINLLLSSQYISISDKIIISNIEISITNLINMT